MTIVQRKPRRAGRKIKQKKVSLSWIVTVDVDNPHFSRSHAESPSNPKATPAQFDMRENYAGYLWARKHIDDAEKRAADRVRAAYERMGGAGARAIDYSREQVDGGQIAQTITDAHLLAAADLRHIHTVLGPEGYHLVVSFSGEGKWPKEFSRENDMPRPGQLFRQCLAALAESWGWKTRQIRVMRVA